MSPAINSSANFGDPAITPGMPAQSIGIILQRGGDELALEKLPDRFTVRLVPPKSDFLGWAKRWGAIHQGRVQNAQLEEFTVEPAHLEPAMQAARESDTVAFVSHVYAVKNNPQQRVYLSDELTLQFVETVTETTRNAIAHSMGLRQTKPIAGVANAFVYEVTKQATENPIKIANRLMGKSEILLAEPNVVVASTSFYRPQDALYPQQWYLYHQGGPELAAGSHIEIEKAWDITRGVRSIVVAITDDAIELDHPDFQGMGKIVAPRDFQAQDDLPLPEKLEDNHGTACAGIAVAEENGSGIVGVAPGCALMPLRTTGYLDDSSIEQLFEWAMTKGAAIISCSWGPSAVYFPLSLRQSAVIHRAATEGREGKGCVVVFAAGNANRPTTGTIDEREWPDNVLSGPTQWLGGYTVHPDVITVSACTSLNKKALYSNWGPTISVCAPSNNSLPGIWLQETGFTYTAPPVREYLEGQGVLTSDRRGDAGYESGDFTSYFGGTSSAAPVVAGVAALVLSVNPNLTAPEVKQLLQNTADKITDPDPDPQLGTQYGSYDATGHSQWFGYGKVNAYRAVLAAQQTAVSLQISRQLKGENNQLVAIPNNDPAGVTSSIQINEGETVKEIQVNLELEHTCWSDLEIYLLTPNQQFALIKSRTQTGKGRLKSTYTLQTTPTLHRLLNHPSKGTWQLRVIDPIVGDTGTLYSWELVLGV
jgi:subtilisin family serine protease